jgi:transcriptional regulator with XRE-family HTH domain
LLIVNKNWKMRAGRPKLAPNEIRLRGRLRDALDKLIGDKRGELSLVARKTGISKQSLSLYKKGEATPTPETLRKLCAGLQLDLNVLGAIISASDLPARQPRATKEQQLSLSLTEAILLVPEEHLRIKVLRRKSQSIDLKVSIDFAPLKHPPRGAKGRTAAVAG